MIGIDTVLYIISSVHLLVQFEIEINLELGDYSSERHNIIIKYIFISS